MNSDLHWPSVVRILTAAAPRAIRIPAPTPTRVIRSETPGPVGPPGAQGIAGTASGFGYATFVQAASEPTMIPAGVRTRVAFDVDPVASVDALNPPFAGHLFWRDNLLRPRHVDDTMILRLDLRAAGQVIGGRIDFQLDIGGTFGVIQAEHYDLTSQAGDVETVTFDAPLFGRDTFRDNGGAIYITCSVPTMVQRESIVVFPLSLRVGGG